MAEKNSNYFLKKFNEPTRLISQSDMRDKLRKLESAGVNVPILSNSVYSPEYLRTDDQGNEIYQLGMRTVSVPSGSLIDSHGTVVNFFALKMQALRVEKSRRRKW